MHVFFSIAFGDMDTLLTKFLKLYITNQDLRISVICVGVHWRNMAYNGLQFSKKREW